MKIIFKCLLLLFYLFLFFSCTKDDSENLDKTNRSILISKKWYGPIESQYFYYDGNDNEVRNAISGMHDTFTFDFNEDSSVMFSYSFSEKTHNGNWKLNNSNLLITSNIDNEFSFYKTSKVLDSKINSINNSEMILEKILDSQEEGISYTKRFEKYISIE